MHYDLSRLGWQNFEHLTQALLLAEAPADARVTIFGSGPDAGREATWRRIPPVGGNGGSIFDGYGVLQAKFCERPADPESNRKWLERELRHELARWEPTRSQRRERPDFLLIATNVHVSAAANGGIRKIDDLLYELTKQHGIRAFQVWHSDSLERLLDAHPGVRAAYAHLVTAGDVFALLTQLLEGPAANLGPTLARQTAHSFAEEQFVGVGVPDLRLSDIAVDLPIGRRAAGDGVLRPMAIRELIEDGDRVLRPSARTEAGPPYRALVGGPGYGKSTATQIIAQLYRAELLRQQRLGPETQALLDSFTTRMRPQFAAPVARRWPFQLRLGDYAERLAVEGRISVTGLIAEMCSAQIGSSVSELQIKAWLAGWPWLLVLDGLDEVATLASRTEIRSLLSDFYDEAADVDADLFVIATTRPQGFDAGFSSDIYEHLEIAQLSFTEALTYGDAVTRSVYPGNPAALTYVTRELRNMLDDEGTARLMTTPLQMVIMVSIIRDAGNTPTDRHQLFDRYYNATYLRESRKPGHLAALLTNNRNDLNFLHERAGFLLQERSGIKSAATPSMPNVELEQILDERLLGRGYSEAERKELNSNLRAAAAERLVLLVAGVGETVHFEVRSLQEYMAARWLASAPDESVNEQLSALVSSAHWSHTWILAVERLLAGEREYLQASIVGLLRQADGADSVARCIKPGARRALELLEASISASSPGLSRSLLAHGLELVALPPGGDDLRMAHVLERVAQLKDSKSLLLEALEYASRPGSESLPGCVWLLAKWADQSALLRADAVRMLSRVTRQASDDASTYRVIRQLRSSGMAKLDLPYDPAIRAVAEVSITEVTDVGESRIAASLPRLRRVVEKDIDILVPLISGTRPVVEALAAAMDQEGGEDDAAALAARLPVSCWPWTMLLVAALRERDMLRTVRLSSYETSNVL